MKQAALLKRLSLSDVSIGMADIAHGAGLPHAGRFSQEFEDVFDELPSHAAERSKIRLKTEESIGDSLKGGDSLATLGLRQTHSRSTGLLRTPRGI